MSFSQGAYYAQVHDCANTSRNSARARVHCAASLAERREKERERQRERERGGGRGSERKRERKLKCASGRGISKGADFPRFATRSMSTATTEGLEEEKLLREGRVRERKGRGTCESARSCARMSQEPKALRDQSRMPAITSSDNGRASRSESATIFGLISPTAR